MRRCVRSNEYQIGRMTPRSVPGGLFDSGFSLAMASLIGPGLLAERFDSPFNTSALVCPKAVLPIAPALMAAAAAPSTVRRLTSCFVRCFIVDSPSNIPQSDQAQDRAGEPAEMGAHNGAVPPCKCKTEWSNRREDLV